MDAGGDDEDDNNVISSVLKKGSSRLKEIMKETKEVFEADNNTSTPAEANTATEADEAAQAGVGTNPSNKDVSQP